MPIKKVVSIISVWFIAALSGVTVLYFQDQQFRAEQAELQQRRAAMQTEQKQAEARLDELQKSRQSSRESYERAMEVIAALEEQKAALTKERDELLGRIEKISSNMSRVTELTGEIEKKKQELRQLARSLRADLPAYNQLYARRYELLGQQQRTEQRLIDLEAKKKELQSAVAALGSRIGTSDMENEYRHMLKEKESLREQLAQIEQETGALRQSQQLLAGELLEQEEALDELQTKRASAIGDKERLAARISEIDTNFGGLDTSNKILVEQALAKHFNAGLFYLEEKEYQKAARELEEVVAIDPRHARARFTLGSLYANHLMDTDKAVEHYRYYLQYAQRGDESIDWVREYVLFWERARAGQEKGL